MKFHRLSTFVLYGFVSTIIDAKAVDEYIKANCFIHHLKSGFVLEANLPRLTGPVARYCEDLIDEFNGALFRKVFKGPNENENCIVKDLLDMSWTEIFMQQIVYETFSSRNVSKKISKEEFNLMKSKVLIRSVFWCNYPKRYDLIARFMEPFKKVPEENPTRSYCLRKYVKDNNLIDPEYKLRLNSEDNEITSETCASYVNEFKDLDENSFTGISTEYYYERWKNCLLNATSELEPGKKNLLLAVLIELDLTDKQKQNELQKLTATSKRIEAALEKGCTEFN